jgi:hypothetical protein
VRHTSPRGRDTKALGAVAKERAARVRRIPRTEPVPVEPVAEHAVAPILRDQIDPADQLVAEPDAEPSRRVFTELLPENLRRRTHEILVVAVTREVLAVPAHKVRIALQIFDTERAENETLDLCRDLHASYVNARRPVSVSPITRV